MLQIRYLHKTRQGIPSIYPQKSGDILQNMNFSRCYKNRGKVIYGFDPNIILYKNVEKCTCAIQGKGETEYEIPSKKVRKLMGIVSGDGYHYYNDDGIEVVSYREAGEDYDDSQHMLLANKEIFLSQTLKLGLQPVWFIRVLREMSSKARERVDCFMEKDETYLVWKNSKRWQMRKIEWED